MSAPKSNDQLVSRFAAEVDVYDRMSGAVAHLLSQILSSEGLIVHSVTHRRKAVASLRKKASKPEKDYQALDDITDLSGIRVTTYFSDDVDRVARLIEREFTIDEVNSVDKRIAIDPDRFGYQSLHYVGQFDKNRSNLVEYKTFAGKRFEIQIRSILQHAWAEIEHDLGYKSAAGVPKEIRRRFARIAGLLEIADDEFKALRVDLRRYEEEVGEKLASNIDDVGLDIPSLRAAYSNKLGVADLDDAIANVMGARLTDDPATHEVDVNRLRFVGIETIAQLERSIKEHYKITTEFAERWISRKYDTTTVGIGVFYLMYVLLAIKGDKGFFKEYLVRFSVGVPKDKNKIAERAIFLVNEIQTKKVSNEITISKHS